MNANAKIAFQGSKPDGIGFIIATDDAAALARQDPRNSDVLAPFLSGGDLNSRHDCSASRWIIDFHDWSEELARTYAACYSLTRELVKPQRDKNNRKLYRENWWHYAERRPGMLAATRDLKSLIVLTLHTKALMPALVPAGQVYSHGLAVFASDAPSLLALLSSSPHFLWAVSHSSTLGVSIRYAPTDAFETFPLPPLTEEIGTLGAELHGFRRDLMLARRFGLTDTYNLVNDETVVDLDIDGLRVIHRRIDRAVVRAYGWDDLLEQLEHGFHPVARATRYTIGPAAQREILDRLLELNHERYAEEVAKGLHHKGKKRGKAAPQGDDGGLF